MSSVVREKPYLVLGGNGKTGRRVVERLRANNYPVRVGSRHAQISFDWENKTTWENVLDDVAAVYISYYPDLALPQAAEAIEAFSSLAVQKGVKRLVLLSGRGEEGALLSEQALQHSGAEWTILRSSWFNQNFSENFFLDFLLSGQVSLPVGKVVEPFIDAEDIAEIAFRALTEEKHIGKLYEITGPRLLTFEEAIAEIAEANKREINYEEINLEQFKTGLEQQGTPAEFIFLLTELFTNVLDGRNAYITDGVQQALGQAPRDFRDYVQDTAKTGIWNKRLER